MKHMNLRSRVEKLEAVSAAGAEEEDGIGPAQFGPAQFGYMQELPSDFVGERHTVVVNRLPDGYYEWEERPGPDPTPPEGKGRVYMVTFVGAVPYRIGDALREDSEYYYARS
jgi:hypothetical protein